MWNTPHRLEIAESVALVLAIMGAIVAVFSGQVLWAVTPLILSALLNLINRYRLAKLNWRRTSAAISRVQQQLSDEMLQLQTMLKGTPAVSNPPLPSPTTDAKSGPVSKETVNLAPLYQELGQIKEQCATVEESVSSIIQYLNSATVVERVDRIEKSLTQLSDQVTLLAKSVEAAAQRRWEDRQKQPVSTVVAPTLESTERSPSVTVQESVESSPTASTSTPPDIPTTTPTPPSVQPLSKSIVLPQFVSKIPPQNWRCLRTLAGHTDWVNSLAVSPDGQKVVSASFDKTVKIWQLHTGELLHTLAGHTKGVFCTAITPDGHVVVSGSWDATIKLWKLDTGELFDTLAGHSGSVRSIAISPNGQMLASGSFDETIKLWQLQTGVLQSRLTDYSGPIYSLAYSPDSKILASGGGDGLIQMWQMDTGQHINTLTGNLDFVWSLMFSPDSGSLASGNGDGTVKLWDVATGELIGVLSEHKGPVYSVRFSSNGQLLMSGSADGSVKIWDMSTGKLLQTLIDDHKPVISLALTPSNTLLIVGNAAGGIKIWQRE
jgi:WD40 repeat protein